MVQFSGSTSVSQVKHSVIVVVRITHITQVVTIKIVLVGIGVLRAVVRASACGRPNTRSTGVTYAVTVIIDLGIGTPISVNWLAGDGSGFNWRAVNSCQNTVP